MKNIVLIIGVVMVLGVGIFLLQSNSAKFSTTYNEQGTENISSTEGAFTGTLAELSARGGNYVCTFSHESSVGESTGTVYIAGDRVRGDFQSVASVAGGFRVETHIVLKDGFTYTWTPIAPNGFKAKASTEGGSGSAPASAEYVDASQVYEYDCAPWTLDESKFELPVITFIDVN